MKKYQNVDISVVFHSDDIITGSGEYELPEVEIFGE